MNTLDAALLEAYQDAENDEKTNRVHRMFLTYEFIIPTEKETKEGEPQVLYLEENNQVYMPIFSDMSHLTAWAGDALKELKFLHLLGKDVIKGVGPNIYLCLDIGQPHYKVFFPDETLQLKKVVARLESMASKSSN